jgi:hypothetical protein
MIVDFVVMMVAVVTVMTVVMLVASGMVGHWLNVQILSVPVVAAVGNDNTAWQY